LTTTHQITHKLKSYKYPRLQNGEAENIEKFYNLIVAPMFANRDLLCSWHNLLVEYVNSKAPTFFIRKHGSAGRENYNLLRRGFTSIDENSKEYVFCDNTLCMTFVSMRIAKFCPDIKEFDSFIKSRNIQCGFGQVSEEKDFALYNPVVSFHPPLNALGWYLAHILPAATNYDEINNFNDYADIHFPRGDQKDWSKNEKIRSVEPLSKKNIMVLKAHFFRLLHPFNSFLVPKKTLLRYNRGNLIGEDPNLIAYVFEQVKQLFPKEFGEFYKIAMGPLEPPKPLDYEVNDISWGDKKTTTLGQKIKPKTMLNKRQHTKNEHDEKDITRDLVRKIGAEAFIYFYLPLNSNRTIPAKELASYAPKNKNWTEKSKASRASKSKKIFKEGRVKEVLELISEMNIDRHLKNMANQYLDDLYIAQEVEFEESYVLTDRHLNNLPD